MNTISGVWLPVVTPFVDGRVDFTGYERLLEHYVGRGVSGIFPVGTTGESPTLDEDEVDAIVERTVAVVAGRVAVFVGIGGNATHKVLRTLRRLERHRFDGIVSVCPYYNRPTQDGMLAHFTRIAQGTERPILIYNIPYRTSVNLANDTLLQLAELPNIVGVKDSSGSLAQSLDLLRRRPGGFAVMTGDDAMFYTMLAHGADAASWPPRTSRPTNSSRCMTKWRPTTIMARGRSGRRSSRSCRCSSKKPTRCRSSIVSGVRGSSRRRSVACRSRACRRRSRTSWIAR
jgi:4-hydroxy-tetrahydrodipicolinate synthase